MTSFFFGPLFVGFVNIALAAILAGYMSRQRNGNGGRNEPWSRVATISAPLIASYLYIPMAWEAWNNGPLFGTWILSVCGVYALYILYPTRYTMPAAIFWASLSALGGIMLRWGLYFAEQGFKHPDHPLLNGLVWMVATVAAVVVTIVTLIVKSSLRADRNSVLFRLHQPGAVKYIKEGPTVTKVVADLTGVPEPLEGIDQAPFQVQLAAQRGQFGPVWAWQLQNLPRRADPRPFLTTYLWTIPAGFYPGIPKFTKVAELPVTVLDRFGNEYSTLQQLPDRDYQKGPFSTGPMGPELSVTVGFNLRPIQPFLIWDVVDWKLQLDHLVDILAAGLVQIVGADLYGFHGALGDLTAPGVARRAMALYPEVDDALDGGPHAGFAAVAGLLAAFEVGVALTLGMQVTTLRVKDVDVDSVVKDITDRRLRTWADRTILAAQAQTVREVAAAQVQALADAARTMGITDPAEMAKILVAAAPFYFLNGDANAALVGVLARAGRS